jgi:hypothetical protein
LGNQLSSNTATIGNMASNVGLNTEAINQLGNAAAVNAGNIANNAQSVGALTNGVVNNMQAIGANAAAIEGVAGNVAVNAGAITQVGNAAAANAANIANNAQAVGALTNGVANNAAGIANNAAAIGDVAANVGLNTQAINQLGNVAATNAGNIANNAQAIGALTTGVATNAQNIGANTAAIAANAQGIGANAAAIGQVGQVAATNAANIANNAQAIGALTTGVATNAQNIAGLTTTVGMLSGSVASNTAAIASLGAQVAVLSEVAAPTVALASMLGVSVGTVSTLALTGSFAGPLLGVVALIVACWPPEKDDPWLKIEARVARMIDDRFKEERRKKLSARLKRYLTEFSSCAHEWAALAKPELMQPKISGNPSEVPASLLSTWQAAMHNASRQQLDVSQSRREVTVATSGERPAIPNCMSELVTTMSLERDEWMSNTRKESMTGLFMPFANMHTQILAALNDYSGDADKQLWHIKQRRTAAEYATFILDQVTDAWKKQVCRTVRLRHSLKPFSANKYKYTFVTLEPKWQPNAGEECKSKCNDKTGWCNFCGGKGVGACCSRGGYADGTDPSECKTFDVMKNKNPICVHNDCAQSGGKYEEVRFRGAIVVAEVTNTSGASACQTYCQTAHIQGLNFLSKGEDPVASGTAGKPPATVFNFKAQDGKCQCLSGSYLGSGSQLKRELRKNEYISGPVYCPTGQTVGGEEDEEQDAELPTVPMNEVKVCNEKSEPVSDVHELEEKHSEWVKECSANATAQVVRDFNPFYQKFAKFVERLAWVSGCGDADHDAGVAGVDENDWNGIVDFPFGNFATCDWKKEEQRTDNEWVPDMEKKRGWLGQSKINMQEQATMATPFAAPGWLVRLMKKYSCLDRTSRRDVANGRSAAIESAFSG